MTGQRLEGQLRVRFIHPLLQRRGHDAIDFTYFGQNVERLDAQAVPAYLCIMCGVQEWSRGWRKHTTGPASQQASSPAVTVPPPWLLFCQQPYRDINSADRKRREQGKNLLKPGAYHDLVLLRVACQRVRQDH